MIVPQDWVMVPQVCGACFIIRARLDTGEGDGLSMDAG